MKFPLTLLSLGGAVMLGAAGCRAPEVARTDFATARAAAAERRKLPRTVEFLEALADRHVDRERRIARLSAAEHEDFSAFNAENDPRFMWALEADCWAEIMLSPGSEPDMTPEARVTPVVEKLLEFEQAVWWARLAALRDAPADDPRREECLLTLGLTTGWGAERIMAFDFSSLPLPKPDAGKSPIPACDPGREVVKTAAELLLMSSRVPPPEPGAVSAKLRELRRWRLALAARYLAEAETRWRSAPDAASLAAWRIARARYELEKSPGGL